MDGGPQPKLGLLLSLTVMNIIAIGIYIYGPSPKERKSSLNAFRININKRPQNSIGSVSILDSNVVAEGNYMRVQQGGVQETAEINQNGQIYSEVDYPKEESANTRGFPEGCVDVDQITKERDFEGALLYSEEDCPKEESEMYKVVADDVEGGSNIIKEGDLGAVLQYAKEDCPVEESEIQTPVCKPPAVEDSELKMNSIVPHTTANNLNIITVNKNFSNDSSKEGSLSSLNDSCGHNAEMRYTPQQVGMSVTAVLKKSYQLIDTFNRKVVPAVENFNDQISKSAHLERYVDSNVGAAMDASICPVVISMNDRINKAREKINQATRNLHFTDDLEARSVSCQVSESLLVKSVPKNSFFGTVTPLSEARVLNLFGRISCKTVARRKDRPFFKTPTLQYWANRKKNFLKKFRYDRCKGNFLYLKPAMFVREEIAKCESFSTVSHVNQHGLFTDIVAYEDNINQVKETNEPSCECVDKVETIDGTRDERNFVLLDDEVETTISTYSHVNVGESVHCPLVQLPSYLSSYDEFDSSKKSTGNLAEDLPKSQEEQEQSDHPNLETQENLEAGNENTIAPHVVVLKDEESRNTSFTVSSTFVDDVEERGECSLQQTSDEIFFKSLEVSSRVNDIIDRPLGPNHQGLQDILDVMLDPNTERNTVENLFALIMKFADTWSESQLTVVPSRAISAFSSPSESGFSSYSISHKLGNSVKSLGNSNELTYGPSHFYSCTDTISSTCMENEELDIDDEETATEVANSIIDEALSRTPEYTEIPVSPASMFDRTFNAITYNPDRKPKALQYKEQYAIARKIAAECIETALTTFDEEDIFSENTKNAVKMKTVNALRASSDESFYSWAPDECSSDDYSYYECDDKSLGFKEKSDKSFKREPSHKRNWSRSNLIREQEKYFPNCQEVLESKSDANCSSAYVVSKPSGSGSTMVVKASSIDTWMLNSTSGDGVEIRNSHSELKSEEMSDLSSRPISFTTDMSEVESNHSFTSESSKDFQIRRQQSSRIFNKMKKKRPMTPKTTINAEAPSHAQSDSGLKLADSLNRNASLSDET